MDFNKIKHIHMIGLGGIGMSAIAAVLRDKGIKITGSDIKNNALIKKLRKKGCGIKIAHGKICGTPGAVVRSFSIKENNPEVKEARLRKIPFLERMEVLKILFEKSPLSIAVTGTHGKTTTTAMISYVFDKASLDPTVLIGGELKYFKGNAKSGKGDILISEVDESDGYLKNIHPTHAVITNVEKEHMEHYGTTGNLLKTFKIFINKKRKGMLLYNADDKNLRKLLKNYKKKRKSFGYSKTCDYYPSEIKRMGLSTEFICFYRNKKLGKVVLNIPGRHNVLNALAAIACGLEFGLKFESIRDILKSFKSPKRRFEIRMDIDGIMVVEDYAHHPTEIKAVISAASGLHKKRIITVFQPHRFSRTKYLADEFKKAFHGSDELILTDIYAASETPIRKIDARTIYNNVKRSGLKNVKIFQKEKIAQYLKTIARKGDIILVLGAGDINGIIPEIKRKFKRQD